MSTKIKSIERHLKKGRMITGKMAMQKFGLYRLSSVIHRLRAKGLNIKTETIRRGKVSFGAYYIPQILEAKPGNDG